MFIIFGILVALRLSTYQDPSDRLRKHYRVKTGYNGYTYLLPTGAVKTIAARSRQLQELNWCKVGLS